jgi:hypothetical protein
LDEMGKAMPDYSETLKRLEEATRVISDESLRRIAFERLLEHELSGSKPPSMREASKNDAVEHASQQPKRSRYKGKAASVSSGAREQVKALELSPDEKGLPPWSTLTSLDKYLWILEVANRNNIDGLTCPEISSLIYDAFKENHKPEQVSNLKTRIRVAHVRPVKIQLPDRELTGYQILRQGIEHLNKLAAEAAKK